MWPQFLFTSDPFQEAIKNNTLTAQQAKLLNFPGVRDLLRERKITLDKAAKWNYRQALFVNTWWDLAKKCKKIFDFSVLEGYLDQPEIYSKICYPTTAKLFNEAVINRGQVIDLQELGIWILLRKYKKEEIKNSSVTISLIKDELKKQIPQPIVQDRQSYIDYRQQTISTDISEIFTSGVVSQELASRLTDRELETIAKWYANPNCGFEDLIVDLPARSANLSSNNKHSRSDEETEPRYKKQRVGDDASCIIS
ncbi:MAG TPA: hypothetical protein VHD33_03350 [Legionellaceae bacterium]|nr:hypothetical protein [Legionellaceae bacterium]